MRIGAERVRGDGRHGEGEQTHGAAWEARASGRSLVCRTCWRRTGRWLCSAQPLFAPYVQATSIPSGRPPLPP